MAGKTREKKSKNILAVVFIKIDRSQKVLQDLETGKLMPLLSAVMEGVCEQVTAHNGSVIKINHNDNMLCSFPDESLAVRAAYRTQEQLCTGKFSKKFTGEGKVLASIGASHGRVLFEGGDLYGHVVNVAARITALAKVGQILLDSTLFKVLPPSLKCRARFVDRTPAKGINKPLDIYEFLWEEEDVITYSKTLIPEYQSAQTSCILRYGDRQLVMDENKISVVVGRGADADMVINDINASRHHLKIDYRHGKYIITDESRNGTWIDTGKDVVQLQRRETYMLTGKGRISLGMPLTHAQEIVEYECE